MHLWHLHPGRLYLGLYCCVHNAFRQHNLLKCSNNSQLSDHAVYQPKAWDSLEYEEESAGEQDESQCERQHAALTRHDDATVTVKAVLAGKHLPFSPGSFGLVVGQRSRRRRRGRCRECLRIYLLIFAVFHHLRRWNRAQCPSNISCCAIRAYRCCWIVSLHKHCTHTRRPRPALLANRSQSAKRDGFTSMWRNAICSGDVTNASSLHGSIINQFILTQTQMHASYSNVNVPVPLSFSGELCTPNDDRFFIIYI